jgi:GcrA cell cycle regulator
MRADRWTDERIGILRTLWIEGATAQAIAARLGGLSRAAVLGKIFRLRLQSASSAPPPLRQDAKAKLDSGVGGARATLLPWRRPTKRNDAPATPKQEPARARGKSLLELTNQTCRWPHGRPGSARFHFCGAPGADLERGMPYCPDHARRAYPNFASSEENAAPGGDVPSAVSSAPPRPQFIWRARVRHPAARWR